MFFADAPAQEMFFALSLWLIWLYIAFLISLWEMAENNSYMVGSFGKITDQAIPGISWVLSLYLVITMIIFYYQCCREITWQRYALGVMSGGSVVLAISMGDSTPGKAMLILLAGCRLLPGLLIGKIRWYNYCLHGLA